MPDRPVVKARKAAQYRKAPGVESRTRVYRGRSQRGSSEGVEVVVDASSSRRI